MPRLTLSKALYWIVLQWRCWTKVDMSVKWYRGHLIPNNKELAGFVSQCRNERYNYRGCPICLKGQIHYRHSNILLHFYCLDVSWMNKAKDIQQLKIIWICFNIFSSDNICERSTVSSVDYNIIWPKKGIFMSILIFVWRLRSSKKKEDFEKRIEIYQNHRAFSPILVTFKLLQNIVRSSADASPPEHSELNKAATFTKSPVLPQCYGVGSFTSMLWGCLKTKAEFVRAVFSPP